jgi:hypothetical protein
MIVKIHIITKNFVEKIGVLTLVLNKNAKFFAENLRKSPKKSDHNIDAQF